MEHKTLAEQEGGKEAAAYPLLSSVVKTITKTAIWMSTKI
ncbi:MAG TPA: demethoxyubiquinone hydroxylase family protein [Candidatus Nitrosotenuis sp.]|nr:demethoxyubiquinone hydroxylase family protein [Candidatus Nitrosotenuis sp.]